QSHSGRETASQKGGPSQKTHACRLDGGFSHGVFAEGTRDILTDRDQVSDLPPSTHRICPVTKSGPVQKNRTAAATSEGSPLRWRGACRAQRAVVSCGVPSGTSTVPGATPLTETSGASSTARARTRPS